MSGRVQGDLFVGGDLFLNGEQLAAGSLGEWKSYTPILTATATNPDLGTGATINGRYSLFRKTVHWSVRIAFGGSSSAGSGNYIITLPVAAANNLGSFFSEVAFGRIFDQSVTTTYVVTARLNGNGDTVALTLDNKNTPVQHNIPFAWTQFDQIWLSGTYEAA